MLLLPVDQKCTVSVIPVDSNGNSALVDGVPSWTSTPSGRLSLVVAPDGMSAEVAPSGTVGNAQISVSADADMSSGVVPITSSLDVSVVSGQAVGFTFQTSALSPQRR